MLNTSLYTGNAYSAFVIALTSRRIAFSYLSTAAISFTGFTAR